MRANAKLLADRVRLSYGMGLMLRLGSAARVELNYCVPVWAQRGDRPVHGVQVWCFLLIFFSPRHRFLAAGPLGNIYAIFFF